ncbi:MAG: HAD-IIIA family hydrolase [Thermoflavifilum sp.]|nr:HAD-IIIA family hydrolase [Thermoflavifilum sp.]
MPVFHKQWTLFLDRDGVINVEKKESYVLSWDEFVFAPGALEALGMLNEVFGHIVVVTNQRCIGKGLLTVQQLDDIHRCMVKTIETHGGRIDRIYFCPDLDDDSPCRKPQTGMAWQARRDFPDIQFHRSVMVGNHFSDMMFGKQLGMYTVWIGSDTCEEMPQLPHPLIDACYPSLYDWAKAIG